eukprot:gene24498-45268_t
MRVISFILSCATCSSFFSSHFRLRANYKSSGNNPLGSFALVNRDRIQSLSAFTNGGVEVDDLEDKIEIDLSTINIWDPDFNPATVFEEEVYNNISTFYRKNAIAGGLSFAIFRVWEEIDELVKEGALSEQDLKSLWAEAPKNFKGLIDFDTFVRLNVRMDAMMDEKEDRHRRSQATANDSKAAPKPSAVSAATGTADKKANNTEQCYRRK